MDLHPNFQISLSKSKALISFLAIHLALTQSLELAELQVFLSAFNYS
jgi:hypothetical protein